MHSKRQVAGLLVGLAFVASTAASFLAIGAHDEWDPQLPWAALSFLTAIGLGFVVGRWPVALAGLVVLPLVIGAPAVWGSPDSDGGTLRDWWLLIGPLNALWLAAVIAVAVAARKGWDRLRGRRAGRANGGRAPSAGTARGSSRRSSAAPDSPS